MYKHEAHSSSHQENEAETMWLQDLDGQGLMVCTSSWMIQYHLLLYVALFALYYQRLLECSQFVSYSCDCCSAHSTDPEQCSHYLTATVYKFVTVVSKQSSPLLNSSLLHVDQPARQIDTTSYMVLQTP